MNRRTFLKHTSGAGLSLALPWTHIPSYFQSESLSVGLIADLHHDIMHDAPQRLSAFVEDMQKTPTDVVVQMGDFATPKPEHQFLVDRFHQAPGTPIHVLGNHDTDLGFTPEECLRQWNIPATYYQKEVHGFTLLVLDGNEKGSPDYTGGYPAYVGTEQLDWLEDALASAKNPVLIFTHQPLLGWSEVDNAPEVRKRLKPYAQKICMCICGHTHIDQILREEGILYWHVNSASYFWVGGNYINKSYSADIHQAHQWIDHTCPYTEPLFARLFIDIPSKRLVITGHAGEWVGTSPQKLGTDPYPSLIHGEHIVPLIQDRSLYRL